MTLPVEHLSVSSLRTYAHCPERWRRRYIEREYEPPSGAIIVGKAAGAAEAHSDHTWIESGEPDPVEAVLDAYSGEFDHEVESADVVEWGDEKPGSYKDTGAGALGAYHKLVVPEMAKPIRVEREARLLVDEVEFVGYLDLETEDGAVVDRKVTKRRWSPQKADRDLQADAYLAVRRAEGTPAERFDFHTMIRGRSKQTAEVLETTREDAQLDFFLEQLVDTAAEIEWRYESERWSYAPEDSWICQAKFCGYWETCPGGGLARQRAARVVRAG